MCAKSRHQEGYSNTCSQSDTGMRGRFAQQFYSKQTANEPAELSA